RMLDLGVSADDLTAWVLALRREVGIAHTLAEVGVPADDIARVARMATEDASAATNPIAFSAADYARILEAALAGDLAHLRSR
ncbi:MAG TPA: iron-containing alcohol dehydrogenase, partial [Caulobacteraceae bacterium]|nr:iron-containing alcohol dehydrogenase [Caulobacteraceae bacterium]